MQTTKWGPSGWNLFHNVAIQYKPTRENKALYRAFYESFKQILPCKYCRQSYSTFFDSTPIDRFLVSSEQLFYWTYLMHNKVNDKLRKQGFLTTPNPSYQEIKKQYQKGCYNKCTYADYIVFIGCVVFNYGSIGNEKHCPPKCTQDGYKTFFNFLTVKYPEVHSEFIKNENLESNCSIVVWYFKSVLVPSQEPKMKLFEKYVNHFANYRASCSQATSCRLKL
jgi:hypothetical protein